VSEAAGPYFRELRVARGVAVADFDCDGDWDILTGNQNAAAALLVNDSQRGHWLKLRLVGVASERRGICARLTLKFGDTTQFVEITAGTSFASSQQPLVIAGLGDSDQSGTITIKWPSGIQQVLQDVKPDQSLIVVENLGLFTDPTSAD
ncbi:MAG: ASPIC/UnbV domain-containing protein, partial [Planctomycetota bacterium]|nr:ASPIC/UnbV domain-containing protein [Planctomycetota bacterium]